jgi:2-polyprenyl-3-methyl-5-hydroxy-6-metoxy-1,4-benzoquinol methylase
MKQNKYDDAAFFSNYSQMARSIGGLDEAGEWPAFRALLPALADKSVLDLGCGFGWHCRYAREQQARRVVGVDLSEKMLTRARSSTNDPAIEYRRQAIEDIDFAAGEFDVVLSSLALHYVERFDLVCRNVQHCLGAGASSSSRSSIRFSQPWLPKIGITVHRGSDYIGRSITIRRKARVRPDFWIMKLSNCTAPSPPM